MKLATPLGPANGTRAPERAPVTERALRHALLVVLAVVISLCSARALIDRLHGHPSGEGSGALILVLLLTAWFSAEVLGAERAEWRATVHGRPQVDDDRAKRRTSSIVR